MYSIFLERLRNVFNRRIVKQAKSVIPVGIQLEFFVESANFVVQLYRLCAVPEPEISSKRGYESIVLLKVTFKRLLVDMIAIFRYPAVVGHYDIHIVVYKMVGLYL